MWTRFTLCVPLLVVLGCASAPRTQTYGLDSGGAALVRQTCADIMGLYSGFAEFDACGDSLAQSVRILSDAEVIARASIQCEGEGFEHGTPDLAKCVVRAKRTVAPAESGLAPLPLAESRPDPSYFRASVSQQHERMELSCAHLGLHPASAGFKQCVLNLRDALFVVQNPL